MDPLSVTASVVTVTQMTGTVLSLINDARGASADRRKCALELSGLYSLLINLQFRLESGDYDDPWFTSVRALNASNGPLDQYKDALGELQRIIDRRGGAKLAQTVVWKFKKEEIASILSRFERLKSLVQLAMELDHFKLSQALKEGLDNLQIESQTTKKNTEALLSAEEKQRHNRVLDWISSSNYPTQQADNINKRQNDTGQWFLESSQFRAFLVNPKQTLFCPGMPGAGKTMISAIVINHLETEIRTTNTAVAYIYCNYRTQKDDTTSALLAAILKQLAQQYPSKSQPLLELYERHQKKGTRLSLEEIVSVLRLFVKGLSTAFVVVDALDECLEMDRTRERLVAELQSLQTDADIRLFFTSRFINDIENHFPSIPRLEIRAAERDVRLVVSGQIEHLPRCVLRSTALQHDVEDAIARSIDGMFLLARLYIDSLRDKSTPRAVRRAIEQFSSANKDSARMYDDAYRDALERIDNQLPDNQALAKKALAWLTYAKRNLQVQELCQALAVEPGDEDLDKDNIYDIEDIVSVCAGLVTVDEESGIVRLVHYTTQEFFERLRDSRGEHWLVTARLDIARTLLSYLSFAELKKTYCKNGQAFKARAHKHALLEYASLYWAASIEGVEDEVADEIRGFLECQTAVRSATQAMWNSMPTYMMDAKRLPAGFPEDTTPLHLIARFGLVNLAIRMYGPTPEKDILEELDSEVNGYSPLQIAASYDQAQVAQWLLVHGAETANEEQQGQHKFTPLEIASRAGNSKFLKILSNKQATAEFQDAPLRYAICSAAAKGLIEVVKMLLDNGADINSSYRFFQPPLIAASKRGHRELVQMLLEREAIVNHQDQTGVTALGVASREGHIAIVKLLLEYGAEADTTYDGQRNASILGSERRSALMSATEKGHVEIVKLLLEHGAEVDTPYDRQRNALMLASENGHVEIARMLLKWGTDVNAQGGRFGSVLEAAACASLSSSSEGASELVKLLLETGAHVNAKGGQLGTALQAACLGNSSHAVQILLKYKADVNLQGGYFGNALQAASLNASIDIIQLLLRHGAHVNAQGGHFGDALRAASHKGRTDAMHLLLKHQARVNAQIDGCKTALQRAAGSGHIEAVQLLLQNGADVNANDEHEGSALYAAANRGANPDIVRLLLDNGANVKAKGGTHGYALTAAATGSGSTEVLQMLLDHGADVNAEGGYRGNALTAAAERGSITMIQMLLDRGATVNAVGEDESRALLAAVSSWRADVVKLLLQHGANVEGQGGAALERAVRGGSTKVMRVLLEHGTGAKTKVLGPTNALVQAAAHVSPEPMQMLLDYGADTNFRCVDNGTALHEAVSRGHRRVAEALLLFGADVNAPNNDGEIPSQMACRLNNPRLVKLLLEWEAAAAAADPDPEEKPAV